MQTVLMVFYVLTAIALVAFVLLQQGKGADAGAAFGSGASATVFGSRGSASFLSRATAGLAMVFFVLAMVLAYMSREAPAPESVAERAAQSLEIPAADDEAESEEPEPPAPEEGGG
jgi:preprotein translocase subunit SecG